MLPGEVCDKHDQMMNRLFNEINEMKLKMGEQYVEQKILLESLTKSYSSFSEKIEVAIFGNGKEGLLTRVSKMLNQVNLQWTLLVLLLGGLIGFILKP